MSCSPPRGPPIEEWDGPDPLEGRQPLRMFEEIVEELGIFDEFDEAEEDAGAEKADSAADAVAERADGEDSSGAERADGADRASWRPDTTSIEHTAVEHEDVKALTRAAKKMLLTSAPA